ncbi:MAG: TrkH family potassium uptake protein, partial [Bacteroidota bacterium]
MINSAVIVRVVSVLVIIIGVLMWSGLPVSWLFGGQEWGALAWSGLVCVTMGGVGFLVVRQRKGQVRKREGYLIVALGWLFMVVFGMLPYLLSGTITSVPDALFETISGMTTTGASVLTDIEAQPR